MASVNTKKRNGTPRWANNEKLGRGQSVKSLLAGVCARSNGRLLNEAQPATCNATKQVHDEGEEEEEEGKSLERKAHDVCESPPSPLLWPLRGLDLVEGGNVFTQCGCGGFQRLSTFLPFTCSHKFVQQIFMQISPRNRNSPFRLLTFQQSVSGVQPSGKTNMSFFFYLEIQTFRNNISDDFFCLSGFVVSRFLFGFFSPVARRTYPSKTEKGPDDL